MIKTIDVLSTLPRILHNDLSDCLLTADVEIADGNLNKSNNLNTAYIIVKLP